MVARSAADKALARLVCIDYRLLEGDELRFLVKLLNDSATDLSIRTLVSCAENVRKPPGTLLEVVNSSSYCSDRIFRRVKSETDNY